jgi:parvulin-like peptidyl-prolyl isomerase
MTWAVALLAAGVLAAVPAPGRPDVVDAIVAVVSGQPITLSDLRAATELGLLPSSAPLDREALVERLIERELKRAEVERFSVTLPDTAGVARRLGDIRERLGAADLAAVLDRLAMSEARLRAWIEDDLRIERYVQQRFDPAAQPSDEEALLWYRSREGEFARDGRPQPFAAVRDEVRARLAAERRRAMLDEWVAGLRRRAAIVIVPFREPGPRA